MLGSFLRTEFEYYNGNSPLYMYFYLWEITIDSNVESGYQTRPILLFNSSSRFGCNTFRTLLIHTLTTPHPRSRSRYAFASTGTFFLDLTLKSKQNICIYIGTTCRCFDQYRLTQHSTTTCQVKSSPHKRQVWGSETLLNSISRLLLRSSRIEWNSLTSKKSIPAAIS